MRLFEGFKYNSSRPELSSLNTAIDTSSNVTARFFQQKREMTIPPLDGYLKYEAGRKIDSMVEILTNDKTRHLFGVLSHRKGAIKEAQEMVDQLEASGKSQSLMGDEQSAINQWQYELYQLFPYLQKVRQAMKLTLTPKDVVDSRRFANNWALFVRGTGHLAGPPWEPNVFKPYSEYKNEHEEDTVEISLAYLHISTLSSNSQGRPSYSSVGVYASPLVVINYKSKPMINPVPNDKRPYIFYDGTNNDMYGPITPVVRPLFPR